MIDYNFYKWVHLIGVFILFLSFGALLGGEKGRVRWAGPVHGIALAVMGITGFGALAKLGIHSSFPLWAIGKMVIWVLLGGALVLAKRKVIPTSILAPGLVALGGLAAFFALWKPDHLF